MRNAKELMLEYTAFSFRDPKKAAEMFAEDCAFELPYLATFGGAAIDVYDAEPLRGNHSYRRADNLLATPHIGYVSRGLYERFYQDSVNNISAWLDERLLSTTKEN